MADHVPKPRRNILPLLIAILAVIAIVLVVAGRLIGPTPVDEPGWQDAIYSVLLAFTVDGTFLGQQNTGHAARRLRCGAGASIWLVLGGLWVVFRRRLVAWWASRSRKHVVVIGDDECRRSPGRRPQCRHERRSGRGRSDPGQAPHRHRAARVDIRADRRGQHPARALGRRDAG